jgi:hypothetical protein
MQIIKEEKERLVKEQWIPMRAEPIRSMLEDIGKQQLAIVQDEAVDKSVFQQLVHLVNAYLSTGKLGRGSLEWRDQVYDLNPKAIAEAKRILTNARQEPGSIFTSDTTVDAAINEFMALIMMGAEEVASDRMAARDTPPAAPIWSGIKTSSFD